MKPLLRWFGRIALVLYVLLVIVVLGVRYWLSPHIDQWREPMAQFISDATGSQVQIGHLQIGWQGWLPELTLDDLEIENHSELSQSPQRLRIPQITARLKWQSLLTQQLQFSYLRIDGLEIDLWRDIQQTKTEAKTNNISLEFMAWLAEQERIELKEAQLIWRDSTRDAMPLTVSQVDGVLQFTEKSLSMDLAASLQAELGQSLQLRGEFSRAAIEEKKQLDGMLYVQFNELNPAAWRQWVDLPTDLQQATLDAQFWVQLQDNQIQHLSMDTRVYNGVWRLADGSEMKARSLRVFAAAPWQGFKDFADEVPLGQRLQSGAFDLEVYGKQLSLENSTSFVDDLQFEEFAFQAERQSEADEAPIQIQQLFAKNEDAEAHVYGTWTPQSANLSLADMDLFGSLEAVEINQLYRYMPMPDVSEEVVEWLEHALVKGRVPEAALRIQGNWHDFPYEKGQGGLFYLGGAFEEADVDYYRPDPGEIGWPKVENASGYLVLKNEGLWVRDAETVLRPNGKDPIQAHQVEVHIESLDADEPILSIQGQTKGAAQAYLGLMSHSDLGALLDNTFEHSRASGQWQVPLSIRLNIEDETQEELKVEGHIEFSDNTVELFSFLPPLHRMNGRLYFSEQGAQAKQLSANWLGGRVDMTDKVGAAGEMLQLQGQAHLDELAKHIDLPVLNHYLEGAFDYQLQVGFDERDQFYLSGASDLKGLLSTLPFPLEKATDTAMPLQINWQAHNEKTHELRVQLAEKLQMRWIENEAETPFFSHGSLSWQQPLPELPAIQGGFSFDVQQDDLNLDAWKEVTEHFTAKEAKGETGLELLAYLRLKSNRAVLFDIPLGALTYTMQQNEDHHWRTDISSTPIAGTVQWQENTSGERVNGIQAKLQRLHWNPQHDGDADDNVNEGMQDFELKLPKLKVTVDDLRWKEWRLGALHLEGESASDNSDQWDIPYLSLHTPHGELNATGFLQQSGVERGLQLQAQVESEQAGRLLNYIGINEVLAQGQGSVQAEVQWLNFPWRSDFNEVSAKADINLYAGRIDQINSKAAKVLEFLSLQSLSRLSRLDFDVRGLFKDGFPFDDMRGSLALHQERISTHNFRVVGPSGTIVIEGSADIDTEQLDLLAVVVPNVDMSGAAIAAGIALNPIVGIGAFVTQLLFKDPLAKAMTVQYRLLGDWDQFEAEEVKLNPKDSEIAQE